MRKGIWTGPKVKKDVDRPIGPHDPHPIVLIGLWHQLTKAQQKRLLALNFDECSWNNNVREQVKVDPFEMWVGGSEGPRTYEVMSGDRARRPMSETTSYEVGANL